MHGADFAAAGAVRRAPSPCSPTRQGCVAPRRPEAGCPGARASAPRATSLGAAAATVYGDPTRLLRVLGVTGTSGKTTVAHLLEAGLRRRRPRRRAARHRRAPGSAARALPSAFTTPEAPDLQALFAVMVEAGRHGRRDGGLQPRARPRPGRRHPLRGRRLHQPVPGPPRLPRRHGGLLRRQGLAVRARARRARGDLRRRRVGRPARRPHPGRGDRRDRADAATGRPARSRPDPTARSTSPRAPRTVRVPVRVQLPGAFNVANALVALACLDAVGRAARRRGRGPRAGRGARADAAGRAWPAVPRRRRLRPQARRRRRAARRAARAGPGTAARRARRGRRPRPRQAPADGRRRSRRAGPAGRHRRQPPRRGPGGHPRRGARRRSGRAAPGRAAARSATGPRPSPPPSHGARPGDAVVVAGQGPRDRTEGRRGASCPSTTPRSPAARRAESSAGPVPG